MNLEDIKKEDIDNIIEYINNNFDEYLFKLPIKPYTIIYIVDELRLIIDDIEDTSLIPNGCANCFTEVCSECPFLEKECKKVGVPRKVWFYLDSPYITYVQQHWNALAFDNYEKCLNKCKDIYGEELVNLVLEETNIEQ